MALNISESRLMIASHKNSFDLVKYFVENYPDHLSLKDKHGFDVLLWCSIVGSVEIFQYLIQKGMDPATTSNTGQTCLMVASRHNNIDLVKAIVQNYPQLLSLKDTEDMNALLHCCVGGSVKIFQYLVQKGMVTSTKSNIGQNCLMIAINNNKFDLVKFLASTIPAQLMMKDRKGMNVLLWCCVGGSIKRFQYLVQSRMDTSTTSYIGQTCLMIAARFKRIALVMYLVWQYPEELPLKDIDGFDALLYCCAGGSVRIFQYLVKRGMDPTTTSNTGQNCLTVAARHNKIHFVKYLVINYPELLTMKDEIKALSCALLLCWWICWVLQYLIQMCMAKTAKQILN